MARRNIIPKKDCVLCLTVDSKTSAKAAFLRGYVSGVHIVSKGVNANERVCEACAAEIEKAMTAYVGNGLQGHGVGFPETNTLRLHPVDDEAVAEDRPSVRLRLVSSKQGS